MDVPKEVLDTIRGKLQEGIKTLDKDLAIMEENLENLGYIKKIDIDVTISTLREMRPNAKFLEQVMREKNRVLEEADPDELDP